MNAKLELTVLGDEGRAPWRIEVDGDPGNMSSPKFICGYRQQVRLQAKHLEGPKVYFWEHDCHDRLKEGTKDPRFVESGGTVVEHVNPGWRLYASTTDPRFG